MTDEHEIHAIIKDVEDVGSCYGCDDQISKYGVAEGEVYVVRLGHTEVRVCENCKDDLIEALQHPIKRRRRN